MRRMANRVRQTIAVLAFLIMMAVCGLYEESKDPLYETIEADPCYGEDSIFYIYDEADYQRFAGYVNRAHLESREDLSATAVDAVLMEDIDLNEGIRPYRAEYMKLCMLCYGGCLDGNGHKIIWQEHTSNGLAVKLGRGAVLKNLDFEVADLRFEISDPEIYGMGMLCMVNYGTIENCRTWGSVTGTGCYTGSMAGLNYGMIKDCRNLSEVVSVGIGEYGAGGIAGRNTYSWEEGDGEETVKAVISGCTNEGAVTGEWMAGGMCAFLDGRDTEIENCGNEGNISVLWQQVQPYLENDRYENRREDWEEARGGGIAGKMSGGVIRECYNTGTVSVREEGVCATYGIAGDAWGNAEVVGSVNLAGTARGKMRHENVMELSPEEIKQWQADHESFVYVYNNWQFDLEEAREKVGLSPLDIEESDLTKGDDTVYLCEDFCLKLPEGFVVTEESDYGLLITAKAGYDFAGKYSTEADTYQVWVLRLAQEERQEMNAFLRRTKELETIYEPVAFLDKKDSFFQAIWLATLDEEDMENDISRIWGYMEGCHWLRPLHFINWWDHHTWQVDGRYSFQLYKEHVNAKYYTYVPGDETGKLRLDNIVSLPAKYSEEQGNEVDYVLIFTDSSTNYRPDVTFAREVLSGFYYLPLQIQVKSEDTLSSISARYTGDGGRYLELAQYNEIEDADFIWPGQTLTIPQKWILEKE